MNSEKRLEELDALRAVAILLVIGYHYFHALAGTETYLYGDRFSNFLLFKNGYSIYLLHFEIGMVALFAIPKNVPLFFQLAATTMVIAIIVALARLSFWGPETRWRVLILQGRAVR